MPSKEDRVQVLKGLYDHLRTMREDDMTFNSVYQQKIHRLMSVQVWLFLGVSFAMSQVEWSTPMAAIDLCVLIGSSVLGVLCLCIGFFSSIKCLGIVDVPILGVQVLEDVLREGSIDQLQPEDLYRDLSTNIAAVISEKRASERRKKPLGVAVNITTQAGFVLVAIFVIYAIVGKVTASIVH